MTASASPFAGLLDSIEFEEKNSRPAFEGEVDPNVRKIVETLLKDSTQRAKIPVTVENFDLLVGMISAVTKEAGKSPTVRKRFDDKNVLIGITVSVGERRGAKPKDETPAPAAPAETAPAADKPKAPAAKATK